MSLTTDHRHQFNLNVTKNGIVTCSTYDFPIDEKAISALFKTAAGENASHTERRLLKSIKGIKLRRLATYLEGKPDTLHGPYREYHSNGILHRKEEYLYGLRHGLSEVRSKTGQLLSVIQYKFGQKNGIHEEYDEKTGLLIFRGYYTQGQYNGPFLKRHKNGTLHIKGTYLFDQLHGDYERRDEKNNVHEKGHYKYGIKTGLWHYPQNKGKEYVWYNDNGKEIAYGTRKNDVLTQALYTHSTKNTDAIHFNF